VRHCDMSRNIRDKRHGNPAPARVRPGGCATFAVWTTLFALRAKGPLTSGSWPVR
jgi:hypothetical protein